MDKSTKEQSIPLAYFITFTTYGTWLHGNEKKSVDKHHNIYTAPLVSPSSAKEKILSTLKAYATRALKFNSNENREKFWTHHGSTRYLWEHCNVLFALRYVVLEQGAPMALFDAGIFSLELDEMLDL
ncbi:MAG TPA: hypothetical protein VI522_06820 [Gammaproteobacteria bacterium]|nr:hypothetical protein [Gammaproteobacteria bacterium]